MKRKRLERLARKSAARGWKIGGFGTWAGDTALAKGARLMTRATARSGHLRRVRKLRRGYSKGPQRRRGWLRLRNPFRSLAAVRAANKRIGHHWFERGAMRFFNTKIESRLLGGKYFITSERPDERFPRKYAIRRANDNGSITTVSRFYDLPSKAAARIGVKALLSSGENPPRMIRRRARKKNKRRSRR